jgi:hypothetical protein
LDKGHENGVEDDVPTFWKMSPQEKEEIEMYKKKEKTQF